MMMATGGEVGTAGPPVQVRDQEKLQTFPV
jgi:hypothetical protein